MVQSVQHVAVVKGIVDSKSVGVQYVSPGVGYSSCGQ